MVTAQCLSAGYAAEEDVRRGAELEGHEAEGRDSTGSVQGGGARKLVLARTVGCAEQRVPGPGADSVQVARAECLTR